MCRNHKWLALLACLALLGCPPDGEQGDLSDNDGSGDIIDDDGVAGGDVALTGTIRGTGAAKIQPQMLTADQGYMIVAQSDETAEIYRATTDAAGEFEIDIPDSEAGNTFMVTIVGPDGQAEGPVVFGQDGDEGITGLEVDGEVSLGTVELPDDPDTTPVEPGADADIDGLADPEVTARLNDDGVPVGVPSHGKGDDALADAGSGSDQPIDADQDGLIDIVDADDDGNGVVDDFQGDLDDGGGPSDIHVNFFMNLKIGAEQAQPYYSGTAADIASALATDTIITFECMTEPSATRTITAAEALETPGPAYMSIAQKMSDGEGGLAFATWAESGYAFEEASDRFQAFVRPNAVMDAGDTFTVEITLDDGTTAQYSRMINYVFKNIPKLVQYGVAGSLVDFEITDPGVNGTGSEPIPFDGTQDLVLVFNPPPDETGAYLTGLDYTFQMFYNAASDGRQLNTEIDGEATWPAPPAGFEGTTYRVSKDDLVLSAQNTYTVTLPKEIFVDSVRTQAGTDEAVDSYKIDITAECPSGNAAIMLAFRKQ